LQAASKEVHFFESAYVFKKVVYATVKGMESENQIVFNACLLPLEAVQPWASDLAALCLQLLMFKIDIPVVPHQAVVRSASDDAQHTSGAQ